MQKFLPHWLSALGLQWKLQVSFFLVTMVTIIINRWSGYHELGNLIELVRARGVPDTVVASMEAHRQGYLLDSLWHSALEFVVLFVAIAFLARLLVAPIRQLCDALDCIEHGDLTRDVPKETEDEVGVLVDRFNAMRVHLNGILCKIDSSSRQMTNSAYQVSSISHEISAAVTEWQERTGEVGSATEQLAEVSASVVQLAEAVQQQAVSAEQLTGEGWRSVQANMETMQASADEVRRSVDSVTGLKEASDRINQVVAAISTIAEQTNLLALNAAIEAARAGEQGRGFAVVADEVRNLAGSTAGLTAEVGQVIEDLNERVEGVSSSMSRVAERVEHSREKADFTADVIGKIAEQAGETAESNRRIGEVSQGQMEKLQDLQASLARLFESSKDNSAKVDTTAGIADDLYLVSEQLNQAISEFTFEHCEQATQAPDEQRRHPRLEQRLRVVVMNGDQRLEGSCLDLSLTGMKLRLRESLDNGHAIHCGLYLPYDDLEEYRRQEPLSLDGRVVWARSEGGFNLHGVQFDTLPTAAQERLRDCFAYFQRNPEYRPQHEQFLH